MAALTRFLTKFAYALTGAVFLAAGAVMLLVNTPLLPSSVQDALADFSQGNLGVLHVLQEFGCTLILVALLSFWFVVNYEQSRGFHSIMTVYWALIAWVHWFHVAGPPESFVGPLITTIPFLVFALLGLMRLKERSPAAAG